MNKADRKALCEYLRRVADGLALRDWTFHVSHEPCDDDDDALACTHPTYGRRVATIEFCRDFRDRRPEVQRHVVVHELLHCHLAAACDVVRLSLPKQLGQPAYDALHDAFRQQVEYAVDGIADGIADDFPLIDWPKPKEARRA